MSDADKLFEQGMHHLGMSRHADLRSEYYGDLEDALGAFEQALALEPDHAGALGARPRVLADLHRHEHVVAACDEALRRQPLDHGMHLARALALHRLGRHMDALHAAERTLQLAPDAIDACYLRAQVLDALRRDDDALAAWTALAAQVPASASQHPSLPLNVWQRPDAARARAQVLARLGRGQRGEAVSGEPQP